MDSRAPMCVRSLMMITESVVIRIYFRFIMKKIKISLSILAKVIENSFRSSIFCSKLPKIW